MGFSSHAIFCTGLLLLVAAGAWADQPAARLPACDEGAEVRDLTLKDAVTVAYTGNPQLLSARQDVEKSKAAVTGALPEPPGSAVTPATFDSYVELDPAVRAAKERVEVAM